MTHDDKYSYSLENGKNIKYSKAFHKVIPILISLLLVTSLITCVYGETLISPVPGHLEKSFQTISPTSFSSEILPGTRISDNGINPGKGTTQLQLDKSVIRSSFVSHKNVEDGEQPEIYNNASINNSTVSLASTYYLNYQNALGTSGSYYWEINAPGSYILDIPESSFITDYKYAIIIKSNNVQLNLNKKTIQGSGLDGTTGVVAYNREGIQIRNGNIKNMDSGIQFSKITTGTIEYINITSCRIGIHLLNSTNITNSNCVIASCKQIAIWINNSAGNTVKANKIKNTKDPAKPNALGRGFGIVTDSAANNNNINWNTITYSRWAGIYIRGTTGNKVTSNTLKYNKWGIHMDNGANKNTYSKNIADYNQYGIVEDPTAHHNTISDNDARSNTKGGIFLYSSYGNTIIKNRLSNNTGAGIHIRLNSDYNTIDSNVISGSNYGINIDCAHSNTIKNNIIKGNKNLGIYNYNSNKNLIKSNILESNNRGISITGASKGNTFTKNTISKSPRGGLAITVSKSYPNTYSSNKITYNSNTGIFLQSTGNQKIVNNYLKNTRNIFFYKTENANTWNTAKGSGTNVLGGKLLGGNYWSQPDGKGYSDICKDANNDGICDAKYKLPDNGINKNIDEFALHT